MAESKNYQAAESEKQINILKKLGFTEDEARIYHVLLVSKESTVGQLSRSINFSRQKNLGKSKNLLNLQKQIIKYCQGKTKKINTKI